jgi:hypothetical protein
MLKLLKKGRQNAQTASSLRRQLRKKGINISLADFMAKIHDLRLSGVFICADDKGYYLASTEAEKSKQINSLNHRYKSIKKVADKLKTL